MRSNLVYSRLKGTDAEEFMTPFINDFVYNTQVYCRINALASLKTSEAVTPYMKEGKQGLERPTKP